MKSCAWIVAVPGLWSGAEVRGSPRETWDVDRGRPALEGEEGGLPDVEGEGTEGIKDSKG